MAVLLGGKPPIVYREYVLSTSQTWTSPITGTARVVCTGGGGQGAYAATANGFGSGAHNSGGGGAGGFSAKTIPIKAGDTFTVVVGAGGNNGNLKPSSDAAGGAGGESTFDDATAISDIALDSNGGAGGLFSQGQGTSQAGAAGGTASGGDVNHTGGAGGQIFRNGSVISNKECVSGGGAVNIHGLSTAPRGGNVGNSSQDVRGTGNGYYITGGGGVGGHGGDFADSTNNANKGVCTPPGTAVGTPPTMDANDVVDITGNSAQWVSIGTRRAAIQTRRDQLDCNGANAATTSRMLINVISYADGNLSTFSENSGFGLNPDDANSERAGSGAWAVLGGTNSNNANSATVQNVSAGSFAGGGGTSFLTSQSQNGLSGRSAYASSGGAGGGGGGGVGMPSDVISTLEMCVGGNGLVIIQFVG